MSGRAPRPAPNPTNAWLLASRPKTLYAAITPVLVGSAAAVGAHVFRPLPAAAALLAAICIQIGTNLANDVFDYKKGADTPERLGPLRVTEAGLLTPGQVLRGMWIAFGAATLLGLYLIAVAGWPVLLIGLFSILAGIAYTGGPFPLGYHGLGDLFVFLFFGLIAVCGSFYVQALTLTPTVIWAALPIGLLATAILGVNNLRDIATDRAAGKRTLAVRIGPKATQVTLVALFALAYLLPLGMWLGALSSPWVLVTWLSIPFLIPVLRAIRKDKGRALNRALAATSQLEFIFGLLLSIGLILS